MQQTMAESMTAEDMAALQASTAERLQEFLANPESPHAYIDEIRQPCKNGQLIWVEISSRFRFNAEQQQIEVIGISRDIEERKKVEQALVESEQKYRLIAENSRDMIWVLNVSQRRFTYISPSYTLQTGFTPEEAIAGGIEFIISPATLDRVSLDFEKVFEHFAKEPQTPLFINNEVQQNTKSGGPLWIEYSVKCHLNDDGEIEVIGVSRDIEERKKRESEILYLSTHDYTTGIFNRSYFESQVRLAMDRTNRYHEPQSMVMFDLDFFKQVNDKYGHLTGDDVLKLIVNTVSKSLRSLDVFARFGGEEFVILMPETSLYGANQAAEKLRQLVESNPHPVTGAVTISMGVAEFQPGSSLDDWYRQADDSLYLAKAGGRNRVVAYSGSL